MLPGQLLPRPFPQKNRRTKTPQLILCWFAFGEKKKEDIVIKSGSRNETTICNLSLHIDDRRHHHESTTPLRRTGHSEFLRTAQHASDFTIWARACPHASEVSLCKRFLRGEKRHSKGDSHEGRDGRPKNDTRWFWTENTRNGGIKTTYKTACERGRRRGRDVGVVGWIEEEGNDDDGGPLRSRSGN